MPNSISDSEKATSEDSIVDILLNSSLESDPAHPIYWSSLKKWTIAIILCVLEVFVTLTTTTYISASYLVQERYGTGVQVTSLGVSMFIVGNAAGPIVLGPLSDISGRKWVYVATILLYAIINVGTALSFNFPMLVIFQFLGGVAGSTALVNVAGSIADLWGASDSCGQPMALFVLGANIGPSLGSPVGEWIAENTSLGLNWIFWINVIIGGPFAAVLLFVPETLPSIVIGKARQKQDPDAVLPTKSGLAAVRQIYFVATMAARIFFTEPIVTMLAIFNGLCYGLLFLYLEGVYQVFTVNNGLTPIGASLSFLNFAVGVAVLFILMPIQTWYFKRDRQKRGHSRPEARFLTSLVLVWLFPASLFWFAFTSNGDTNYWSPIVAGGVLAFIDALLYLSDLNYIADSYPAVANSAIAAFLVPTFFIAAGLTHIAIVMYANLGTTWAFGALGFISLGVVVLTYVIYFFGPWLRRHSRLAVSLQHES